MEVSKRLKAVAELVSAGSIVCDVGCDHGYVPIYLIQNHICPKVIAMDVGAGPLNRAREHIRTFCLEKYIVTRLSDGVAELREGEADCLILAGMGGRLVIKILTEGRDKIRSMQELILQPQSDIAFVRSFLRKEGWRTVREDMVYEDGKYYPMMKVTYMSQNAGGRMTGLTEANDGTVEALDGLLTLSDKESCEREVRRQAYDRYGEYLLQHRHPVLHDFLLWEQEREAAISREIAVSGAGQTQRGRQREAELQKAEKVRAYALSCFAQP